MKHTLIAVDLAKDVHRELSRAHWSLILLTKEAQRVLPGKLYEYMGSGRPILAVVPSSSEVAKIIERTNAGLVAPVEDLERACERVGHAIELACSGRLPGPVPMEELAPWFDASLVEQTAKLLDELKE